VNDSSTPAPVVSGECRRPALAARAASCLAGAGVAGFVALLTADPIGRAFWGLLAVLIVLPLPASWMAILCAGTIVGVLTMNVPAAIIVTAFGWSIWGVVWALPHRSGWLGSVLLAALLWLCWPLWLPLDRVPESLVDNLVRTSPVFAINASIDRSDPFTHRPRVYQLTRLGQDVAYAMPADARWVLISHLGVAGLMMSVRFAGILRRRKNRP
jgi:hypothetical protein